MNTIKDYFENEVVKGSILGSAVMFAATPGINYVVSRATNKPMLWSQPFTGGYSLAGSGAAGCATTFFIKSCLTGGAKDHELSEWQRLWTSFVAGVCSGVVLCPFESIAQTQLTTESSSLIGTAKLIHHNHGVFGFFRGTGSMMLREGSWSAMYIALAPILRQRFKEAGYNDLSANLAAVTISFGIFGVLSTPINRARIMMQANLAESDTPRNSYRQLMKIMLHNSQDANPVKRTCNFFKGAGPRSITSALAGGLFVKGTEWYDDALKCSSR